MELQTSKKLGGIGALILFLGIIPAYIGFDLYGIPTAIGIILVLISLHSLAKFYKDKEIFNNALFGTLAAIIGAIISLAIILTTFLPTLEDAMYQAAPDWNGNWIDFTNIIPNFDNINSTTLLQLTIGTLLIGIVVWVFIIISMIFIRKSLKTLADHSHTNLFATTSRILIIGAAIPILGILIIWISSLILANAFLTMKEPQQTPSPII